MGQVVELRRWRRRHEAGLDDVWRLEAAVQRLDVLVHRLGVERASGDPDVETEILAITGAVAVGFTHKAADRAELLADLLERRASGDN